jgi:hypothetical protein
MKSSIIRRLGTPCVRQRLARCFQGQSRLFSEKVKFFFIEGKSGDKIQVTGEVGKTVLDVAVAHDIDIEGA